MHAYLTMEYLNLMIRVSFISCRPASKDYKSRPKLSTFSSFSAPKLIIFDGFGQFLSFFAFSFFFRFRLNCLNISSFCQNVKAAVVDQFKTLSQGSWPVDLDTWNRIWARYIHRRTPIPPLLGLSPPTRVRVWPTQPPPLLTTAMLLLLLLLLPVGTVGTWQRQATSSQFFYYLTVWCGNTVVIFFYFQRRNWLFLMISVSFGHFLRFFRYRLLSTALLLLRVLSLQVGSWQRHKRQAISSQLFINNISQCSVGISLARTTRAAAAAFWAKTQKGCFFCRITLDSSTTTTK